MLSLKQLRRCTLMTRMIMFMSGSDDPIAETLSVKRMMFTRTQQGHEDKN